MAQKVTNEIGDEERTFIYFVRSGEFIKIGQSKRWKKRIANMQIGSPHCVLRSEKRFPLPPRVPIFPPRRAKGNVWPDRSLRAGETSLLTCGTAQGLSLSPPRRCVFRDSLGSS